MKIYKVKEQNGCDYQGCGYALGVVSLGKLTHFYYLDDLDEDFDCEDDEDAKKYIAEGWQRMKISELSRMGQVLLGMLSCWEFYELSEVAK